MAHLPAGRIQGAATSARPRRARPHRRIQRSRTWKTRPTVSCRGLIMQRSAEADRRAIYRTAVQTGRRIYAWIRSRHGNRSLAAVLKRKSRDNCPCSENIATCEPSVQSTQQQGGRRSDILLIQACCYSHAHAVTHVHSDLQHICLHVPQLRGVLTASPRAATEAGAHMVCCTEQRITGRGTPDPGPRHGVRRCGWSLGANKTLRRCGREIIL